MAHHVRFPEWIKKILVMQFSFSFSYAVATVSIFGLMCLSFLGGAAVMYFQLPFHELLDGAFAGAHAWHYRGQSSIPLLRSDAKKIVGVTVDKPGKTFDGFTLYSTSDGTQASLIDMHGNVVHHWALPFSQAFPHPRHVANPLPDDEVHWFRCYLYPNGDLLAIYHAHGDTPYGYGLAKMDKDSKLLWSYARNVHHDLDVGEDGTIYTLTQKVDTTPPQGIDPFPVPYIADFLAVLSPDGKEMESIPILEAFLRSPYALTLYSVSKFSFQMSPIGFDANVWPKSVTDNKMRNDILHTNSVKVLRSSVAEKFPLFKKGQVLLSVRHLDSVVVIDRPTQRVTWQAQGIWREQHDADFLDNGHLLLYDNTGSLKGARILEFDPVTQAIPWAYPNAGTTAFRATTRGMKQRLPNGNTLIIEPGERRIMEVTLEKELVWEMFLPLPTHASSDKPALDHALMGARRYIENELTFLRGVARPRP